MELAARDPRRMPWYGLAAATVLVCAQISVFADVLWVRRYFYQLAWWPYIFCIDALIYYRTGRSLLRTTPREFFVLSFWSIPLWCIFEILNFRLQNWAYINVPPPSVLDFSLGLLAFATVLPGLFETDAVLRTFNVFGQVRCPPLRVSPRILFGSIAIGMAMLAAVVTVPRLAFPLTWGFAVFLCDPINYRWHRRGSLLAHWEAGDPRTFLRLLTAGLICGGLWEFWNYWAYTKWLYTVPGLEHMKWFEMPPLGFLGFPPFAVECYVIVNCLTIVRRGRRWEFSGGGGAGRAVVVLGIAAALAFNVLVYAGISRYTVISTAPTMADLAGVQDDLATCLDWRGLSRPPSFLAALSRTGFEAVARLCRVNPSEIEQAAAAARIADLDGLGAANQRALWSLGVRSLADLARQDPTAFVEIWQAAADRPPTAAQIRLWIRAAQRRSRM